MGLSPRAISVSEQTIPKHLPASTSKPDESPRGRLPADAPGQMPSPSERHRVRSRNTDGVSIRALGSALPLLHTLRKQGPLYWLFSSHLTRAEAETQRGSVTGPGSQGRDKAEQQFEPGWLTREPSYHCLRSRGPRATQLRAEASSASSCYVAKGRLVHASEPHCLHLQNPLILVGL